MDVHYPPESDLFFQTVRTRVDNYFIDSKKRKFATRFFFFKAFLLISIYIGLYLGIFFLAQGNLKVLCMILMGPFAILIGINVAHDAAHGNISSKKWVNQTFLFCFDLLGTNSYIWKKRHVFSHHVFPNILNKDADLKQNPMVRIFPNDEVKKIHRYQFIYAPFLYLLYTINWLFFRDYKDFFASEIGSLKLSSHSNLEFGKLLFFKLFYISYIFVFPLMFAHFSWSMLLVGFLGMNFTASLLITLALIPSHVAENSLFLLPDENGIMPHSWSHHQVLSVIDFATGNWFLNFFFGGFNHHVTHHLFPNINHVHSVYLTPIIKQTAAEFQLQYNHENSFLNAYISHYKLLKNNGIQPTLNKI